ncbi:hypothetical protein E4U16_006356 [Claviceps sp. LM84 group G4]|nr:hypothetical protein E4U33_006742 [Claviceps sp. LM78 group G4]KAG6071115.1 hypothetical protein E4U16_006356 [Claviceps sp. LM84 group G4]
MANFPEDTKYFQKYMLNCSTTFAPTLPDVLPTLPDVVPTLPDIVPTLPSHEVWWPEGSEESGAIPEDPLPSVGSCESGRLRRKRRRRSSSTSSSTSSAELRDHLVDSVKQKYAEAADGVIDYDKGSHDAQLRRERNAQASRRSRSGLKTMQQRLDESEKGRKLAEEKARQAEEVIRQAEEVIRQRDEGIRQRDEGIRQRDEEIERLKRAK